MSIDNLIETLNLPKELLDKTSAFLGQLLGPSVDEAGQLIADKIRFHRFRNQVKILLRSEEILDQAGLKARSISLQTLVPLIEKASLEEDPSLQEIWARLLSKAATSDTRSGLHRLCVHIVASISPAEALVLQKVFEIYTERRPELMDKMREWNPKRPEIYASSIFFRPDDLFRQLGVPKYDNDLLLDNLLRLNMLRWEVSEIEDGQNVDPRYVHLTELGLNVLKECLSKLSD